VGSEWRGRSRPLFHGDCDWRGQVLCKSEH
jgi:hypothetical protein